MHPTNLDLCTTGIGGSDSQCGGGEWCPSGYKCYKSRKQAADGHIYFECDCVSAGPKPWPDSPDSPRQEVAALTTQEFIREFLGQLPAPPDFAPNALVDTQAQRRKCFRACYVEWIREHPLSKDNPYWDTNDMQIFNTMAWAKNCVAQCLWRKRQEGLGRPDMMY